MSISDAYVRIMCDECFDEEEIELSFVYPDFSGKGGHYDHDEKAVMKKAEKNGWVKIGDKHYCEECAPEHEESGE